MNKSIRRWKVQSLFEVRSGDYHALIELDAGNIPLISCGDTNNGCIGYYDIPEEKRYKRALTVAYNGSWPLMSKYHPYSFGAKDDVAVLVPLVELREPTLLYIAGIFNGSTWRYSYGRKCFRSKLVNVLLPMPVTGNGETIDEDFIEGLLPPAEHKLYSLVLEMRVKKLL